MTKEALIEDLQLIQHRACVDKDTFVSDAIATAIETIEGSPCEDCVSRGAVKEQFKEVVHNNGSATEFLVRLWELPSVTPTRPTGKWIDSYRQVVYRCSECNALFAISDMDDYSFCPNCGARMEGDDNAE